MKKKESNSMLTRKIATNIFNKIFFENKTLNASLDNNKYFNNLNQKDKSFIYMLLSLTMRRHGQIKIIFKKYLKKKLPKNKNNLSTILTLATTEIIWLNTPDYAVTNSYVELVKKIDKSYLSGFVNAILRNIIRDKEKIKKIMPDITENVPKKMYQSLMKYYGKKTTKKIIEFFMIEPNLDVICSNKISSEQKQKLLSDLKGVEIFPNVIRSLYKGNIQSIYGYEDGLWWIQDFGSYLQFEHLYKKICLEYNKKDIQKIEILDLCSAPGGKTSQILDKGLKVISVDNNRKRINKMNENFKRLKLNPPIICQNVEELKFNKKFDVIVLDSPCSSSGTIRKNPDIFFRNKNFDYKKITQLQKLILKKSSNFLKINGFLMYIVCSIDKTEGEEIINNFCKKNKNFKIVPIDKNILNIKKFDNYNSDGFLRILPHSFNHHKNIDFNGSDCFFSAIIKKIKD